MPGWITTDYWNSIDEKWQRWCDCGLFPRRLVAYEGVDTGRTFTGCHYKPPKCTFVDWIDKPHPQSLSRALTAMWTLAEEHDPRMSEEEYQQALEEARQEERQETDEKINAIKSTCLAMADLLVPMKEQLDALYVD